MINLVFNSCSCKILDHSIVFPIWIGLAAASDKVYQLLAQGLWFYSASSTTKTGCHDIAGSSAKKTKFKSTNLNQNTLFVTINIDSPPPNKTHWICYIVTIMRNDRNVFRVIQLFIETFIARLRRCFWRSPDILQCQQCMRLIYKCFILYLKRHFNLKQKCIEVHDIMEQLQLQPWAITLQCIYM